MCQYQYMCISPVLILHLDTYILWYYAAMPWRRRGTSSNTIVSGMDCTHSLHYAPARNVVLSMSVPSMQRMERWPKLLQLFRWEIVSNKGICCQIDRSFGLVVWDVRVLWSVIQGRFLSRVVSQDELREWRRRRRTNSIWEVEMIFLVGKKRRNGKNEMIES